MSPQHYSIPGEQFINGKWVEGSSDAARKNINPYDQSVIFEMKQASQKDVDKAYEAAEKAAEAWGKTSVVERTELIRKVCTIITDRQEEIMGWIAKELGGTFPKAGFEWNATRLCAEAWTSIPHHLKGEILTDERPGKYSFVFRKPLGVIGVISPWNFPFILSARSVIPAIALGNTVVLKPASDTPVMGALILAKIFEEAGCPEGVLNVVVGTGGEIGDYFVYHPTPRLISFTGSTEVGRRVGQNAMTGANIKRISLELGGNSPLVVLDDADIQAAAGTAVMGRFLHSGQICMSTNRIIVDKKIEKEFTEAFVAGVKNLKVGNPLDPDTIIGPIINQQQLDGLLAKIKNSVVGDTKQLLGGDPDGLILPPHVYSPVGVDHPLYKEETFGPLAPIIVAENDAHALQLANDTDYGLSSAVFTQNMERGLEFAQGIYTGMTHINDMTVDDQPYAPFGGEKNSGLGRFNCEYIMEEFTRAHWITWKSAT